MVRPGVMRQFGATASANLISVSYGTCGGWTSPAIPELLSSNSPLPSGSITTEQASWIVGNICLGGIAGCVVAGWAQQRYGRKWTLWFGGLPVLIGWILVIVANHPYCLMAARCLAGFTGGIMYLALPLYVSEIAEDRIRGALASIMTMAMFLGILLGYILGAFLPYSVVPWVSLVFPLLFLASFPFFPETPFHLAKMNKVEASESSLRFFRGVVDQPQAQVSKEFHQEINQLRSMFTTGEKQLPQQDAITWADLTTRHAKRTFLICTMLMVLNQFSGCFLMINYAATVFAESGSTLSANESTIIVGLILIVGSYCSTLLVDRIGRKILLMVSSAGVTLGQATFAGYCYMKTLGYDVTKLQWLPLLCFASIILIGTLGVLPLPYVVMPEIVPQKIKGFATTFSLLLSWGFAFICFKYFAAVVDLLGMHGTLLMFSGWSALGLLFVLFMLPETKGKSFEEIAKLLQ